MSNLETSVPMLYSEGVVKRRISLERMVELVAANPAKIFGLYPRKGAIVEGADADLVVFDPNAKVIVRATRDAFARRLRSVRGLRGDRMAAHDHLARRANRQSSASRLRAPAEECFLPRAPFSPT